MKACYEDETLDVSKEDFEKPADLSINVDCTAVDEGDLGGVQETEEQIEVDF